MEIGPKINNQHLFYNNKSDDDEKIFFYSKSKRSHKTPSKMFLFNDQPKSF